MYAFLLINNYLIHLTTSNLEIIIELVTVSVIFKNILGGCQN